MIFLIDDEVQIMITTLFAFNNTLGAWCAMTSDVSPFIQVDFKRLKKITRVATQGRPDGTSYVKKYSLSYSLDGITWTEHDQVSKTFSQLSAFILHPLLTLDEDL